MLLPHTSSACISEYSRTHLNHRGTSEPTLIHNSYASPTPDTVAGRLHQFHFANRSQHRVSSLHRCLGTDSLRDLQLQKQQQFAESSSDPLFQPFHVNSPPPGMPGVQSSSIAEDQYGPSPPGTGAIPLPPPIHPSDSRPVIKSRHVRHANPLRSSDQLHGVNLSNLTGVNGKRHKFVCVTGYSINRRLRRGYDEIQRFYHCSWPDFNKAYGTLNHLNAHVKMQKHGQKRSPNGESIASVYRADLIIQLRAEFQELRKQWRKAKKETAEQACSKSRSIGIPPHNPHAFAPAHSQMPHVKSTYGLEYFGPGLSSSDSVPAVTLGERNNGMDVPVDDNRLMLDDRERFAHCGEVMRNATGSPPERPLSNCSYGPGFPVGCYSQAQPSLQVNILITISPLHGSRSHSRPSPPSGHSGDDGSPSGLLFQRMSR